MCALVASVLALYEKQYSNYDKSPITIIKPAIKIKNTKIPVVTMGANIYPIALRGSIEYRCDKHLIVMMIDHTMSTSDPKL